MQHQQWEVQYVRKKKSFHRLDNEPARARVSKKTKTLLSNHETGDRVKTTKPVSGLAIAQARQALGMTQADLAKRMQVTKQIIQQWEKGTQTPQGPYKARLKQNLPGV